ncbi:MAG: hypothetical protein U0491_02495 [Candidatus Saccharimonadales bacterium]
MSKKLNHSAKSYAIIYGFAEGPYQARMFAAVAKEYGLKQTKVSQAEIIFAHSGGCFLIPTDSNAIIVHVNPTIWPQRSIVSSLIRRFPPKKVSLISGLFRLYYALDVTHAIRMVKARAMRLNGSKCLIVRNSQDTYLSYEVFISFGQQKIEFDGGHDDIWQNPEKYIQLVV